MNYVKEYLKAIHDGTEVVGVKIKTLYERECAWMNNPPFEWHFDETIGEKPIKFIEKFCRHSKGRWAGKIIKLELFQKAAIQLAY